MDTFCKEIDCPVYRRYIGEWEYEDDKKAYKKNACGACMAVRYSDWLDNKLKKLVEERGGLFDEVY
jgi:hypothetical protein